MKPSIPLFWWSEIKFLFKEKENYGDLLSKYLVERISGKKVKWVQPKKQSFFKLDKTNFLAIGSILPHATRDSIVWGSGIIDREHKIAPADFRAVRGPRTFEFLKNSGYECPEVYGDPALLLPKYYTPEVRTKYKIGIIPHYNDYKQVKEMFSEEDGVLVIDMMTLDVEEVTRQMLSCEKTISSSLHGLIVSHAYQIPSIWVEFSDKIFGDGIKYPDYLESVSLPVYQPPFIEGSVKAEALEQMIEKLPNCPDPKKIQELQAGLMKVCPF